jgi:hypothetical protein
LEIRRRTVLKGFAAGGALLALGSSGQVNTDPAGPAPCGLLLGHTGIGNTFESGVRGVLARAGYREPEVVRWEGGPLASPSAPPAQVERSSARRWIVILDDAGAAVFQEMVRGAGWRLLVRGSHAYWQGGSVTLRHEWVTASPQWSAKALLVSLLRKGEARFSITESFLAEATVATTAQDACLVRSHDWVECVGQVVAASAIGLGAGREPAAPVLRARDYERRLQARRFTSFVVDL